MIETIAALRYNRSMKNRIEKFRENANHPFYKKKFLKLTKKQIEFCEAWIIENDHLSEHDYAFRANRIFLDNLEKIKDHVFCQELIYNCK